MFSIEQNVWKERLTKRKKKKNKFISSEKRERKQPFSSERMEESKCSTVSVIY